MSVAVVEGLAPWAGGYIGIPYRAHGRGREGADCWGLVRLVLAEVFGVAVPDMARSYPDPDDRGELDRLVQRNLCEVMTVRPGDERPGDVLFFAQAGHVSHCGIAIGAGFMLHARDGRDTVMETYRAGLWLRRLHGIFRHGDLA